MSLYAIMHKKGECNGCGLCAKHAPNYWRMNEEGEAELSNVNAQEGPYDCGKGGRYDGYRLLAAARSCPLQAIRLF